MSSNAVAGKSQNASGAIAGALPKRSSRTVAGHRAQVLVQTPQQIYQDLPFFHLQARQQPSFALERCDDDPVMNGPSLPRQPDRVRASITRIFSDRDKTPLLHRSERAAHRSLVEADDVADAGCGNARLDRKQRHHSPFRDVDAELALIERSRAVGQLVRDESDERGDITVEIELRPVADIREFGLFRPAWLHEGQLPLVVSSRRFAIEQ